MDPQFNDLTNIRLDYLMGIVQEINVLFESEPFEKIVQIIQDNKMLTPQEKKFVKNPFIKDRNINGKKANMLNSLCVRCQSELSAEFSCLECVRLHIKNNFSKWTTGNKFFDFWIQNFQLKFYARSNRVIEWVPYEKFQNIEIKASGGFGIVYIAKWMDGSIHSWDAYKQKFLRGMPGPVILKSMKIPEIQSENFYQEILVHITVSLESPYIVSCYGLTKEPRSGDFMMILEYLSDGDLKEFLKNKDISLSWRTRYSILHNITSALSKMHLNNILHGDIHPGNIISSRNMWCVGDLGLCKFTNEITNDEIFGILPYIAPEVLLNANYTTAADIYSVGIIMWQLVTKRIPYDYAHDTNDIALAIDISNGIRPEINCKLPSDYEEMMKRCWNSDSLSRPTASELLRFFTTNLQKIYKNELIISELDDNLNSSLFTSDNDLIPKIINSGKIKIHYEQSNSFGLIMPIHKNE